MATVWGSVPSTLLYVGTYYTQWGTVSVWKQSVNCCLAWAQAAGGSCFVELQQGGLEVGFFVSPCHIS